MPKYEDKAAPSNSFELVLLLALFAPIVLLIMPVVIVFGLLDRKKRKAHFENLMNNRSNDSICTFARYFERRKIDTWVIRAVYEQLQNYLTSEVPEFPVRPSDDVFIDLRIDDEDFEYDLIDEIAQRTGRSLENAENNPYYGKAHIVENIVYLFNEQAYENVK
jgi:hypothetical protein